MKVPTVRSWVKVLEEDNEIQYTSEQISLVLDMILHRTIVRTWLTKRYWSCAPSPVLQKGCLFPRNCFWKFILFSLCHCPPVWTKRGHAGAG